MQNETGAPSVTIHALEVHDDKGHLRTHLMPGGRYWRDGGAPHHPVHGPADEHGVIVHRGEN